MRGACILASLRTAGLLTRSMKKLGNPKAARVLIRTSVTGSRGALDVLGTQIGTKVGGEVKTIGAEYACADAAT